MVVSDIKQCLSELEEELVPVPAELVDPSVARIFAKSKRGKVSYINVLFDKLDEMYTLCAHFI